MTNRALWIFAAYLRATVRTMAVRLVRTTLYHSRFVDVVERWILDGWSMRTIEMCVFHGVDAEYVAAIGRRFT